ncbi:MAG: ComF family protein [Bacteroidaceae bacterium]|nr:ComF family protein [Bacteroidaceae bacterium]
MLPILPALRNLLFPRRCLVCGTTLQPQEPFLCTHCLSTLPYTGYHGSPGNNAERLFYGTAPVERAEAYLYYHAGASSSQVIRALKYRHRPEVGLWMGSVLAASLADTDFLDGITGLIAIPLAPRRQRHRGYNQSLMIAEGIASATGLPLLTDVVRRIRENPTQTHLLPQQRRQNVEGIFRCEHPELIRHGHLLVVDDVVTTGATLSSCINAMKDATPTARFSVITLAHAAHATSLHGISAPCFDV